MGRGGGQPLGEKGRGCPGERKGAETAFSPCSLPEPEAAQPEVKSGCPLMSWVCEGAQTTQAVSELQDILLNSRDDTYFSGGRTKCSSDRRGLDTDPGTWGWLLLC